MSKFKEMDNDQLVDELCLYARDKGLEDAVGVPYSDWEEQEYAKCKSEVLSRMIGTKGD
jgi:hypothetical protein